MQAHSQWSRALGICALGLVAVACADQITTPGLSETEPLESVSQGETLAAVKVTNPSTAAYALKVGDAKQMSATLLYSRGGTLPSAPYAQWMSSDNCVAKVTSASPSWGRVTGVKAGTALIIVSAFGKADTVKVKVEGTGNLDSRCEEREWSWDYSDVSFTGEPASRYHVAAGEKLRKLVLFAPEGALRVGQLGTVVSELWYSGGGKLNGAGYVSFSSTDGSVARINSRGAILGVKPGRTKLIVRLGTTFADTVPLYVK